MVAGHRCGSRPEVVRGPLPDVADHLPATPGAVPGWQRGHITAAQGVTVQLGACRARWGIAPGKAAFRAGQVETAGCCGLPLGFGRQPPAGPAAVGLGLIPVDVEDRPVRLQRQPAVEVAPKPALCLTPPVQRLLGSRRLLPVPASRTPQLRTAIPIGFHERGELALGHRRAGDGERPQRHGVRPLLVIEDERLVGRGPQHESAAGHEDVSGPGTAIPVRRFSTATHGHGQERLGVSECLPGVKECLAMHVLMVDRQQDEVAFPAIRSAV
jgi:hypothetical protein